MRATPAAGLEPAAVNPDHTKPSSTVLMSVAQLATKKAKRQSSIVFLQEPDEDVLPLEHPPKACKGELDPSHQEQEPPCGRRQMTRPRGEDREECVEQGR